MSSRLRILSLEVDPVDFNTSLQKVTAWGLNKEKGFVCFANVHMTIEAENDPALRKDLENARLVLPDGKPVALACHWLYHKKQERVAGMDFMPALLSQVNRFQGKIFLYGSTQDVLDKLRNRIREEYPDAILAGMLSPSFGNIAGDELQSHIRQINDSGAQFVMVALGCPKQEKWMASNFQSINAILLGLGGAFPVMAGIMKRCPAWMSNAGLEWLYRLLQEPRRLLKRYLYTNARFIYLLTGELIRKRLSSKKANITN